MAQRSETPSSSARSRRFVPGVLSIATLLLALDAAAREPDSLSAATLRANTGVGAGNVGLAVRAAAEGELWVSPWFGVGAELGSVGQLAPLGDSTSAWMVGPVFAVRSRAGHGYWLFTSTWGYASQTRSYSGDVFCFDACTPTTSRTSDALFSSLGIGYLSERAGQRLTLGVALKLDVLGQPTGGQPEPQAIGTLNFRIGGVLVE